MTAPSNGYAGGRLPGREVDPAEGMAAYDRLPPRLRALVADMPMDVEAASAARLLETYGEEDVDRVALVLAEARKVLLAECRRLSEEACAL